MNQNIDKSIRQLRTGREILLALKTYGPLSQRTLRFILGNPSTGKVKESLKRLHKLKLIQKVFYRYEERFGVYYYIDSRFDKRLLVADLLKCNADDLKLECLRHVELPHEQRCARIHFDLVKMFPEAKIYRDYQLDKCEISNLVFPSVAIERRVYPDILLHFVDKNRERGECFIAFEIEEALKSKKRIMDKLRRYATESLLDGVIYISTKSQIIETIRCVFSQKVLEKNLRIKHYGSNFLLFQVQEQEHDGLSPGTFNLDARTLDFETWALALMRTKNTERRNGHFDLGVTKGNAKKV